MNYTLLAASLAAELLEDANHAEIDGLVNIPRSYREQAEALFEWLGSGALTSEGKAARRRNAGLLPTRTRIRRPRSA